MTTQLAASATDAGSRRPAGEGAHRTPSGGGAPPPGGGPS